jgi:uncharacterized membrane protein YbaN (DUF454 family)
MCPGEDSLLLHTGLAGRSLRVIDMLQRLKQAWREFKRSRPGCRFQELYQRRQKSRRAGAKRALFIVGGLLIIAGGVISFPVPGIPSELIIVAGLGIFAQGSKRAAQILDWIELRLRGPMLWAWRIWRPLPRAAKIVIGALWMALLAMVWIWLL